MPPATDAVERWRATSGVQSVSLFRIGVDGPKHTTARERTIAGYTILQGAPVSLSDSLVVALIDWLRDPSSFSDAVMPRCFPGKRFGFRVDRDVPTIGHELSEIAVDLGCESIAIENQEGRLRSQSYTYFGGAGQGLIAVLRAAMPKAELRGRYR